MVETTVNAIGVDAEGERTKKFAMVLHEVTGGRTSDINLPLEKMIGLYNEDISDIKKREEMYRDMVNAWNGLGTFEHISELVAAEKEGRIQICTKQKQGKCGTCKNFCQEEYTKRGTCKHPKRYGEQKYLSSTCAMYDPKDVSDIGVGK